MLIKNYYDTITKSIAGGIMDMSKLKILVVDDEARMRKLVKDFLVRKDYEVIEAADGEEAIDLFVEHNDFDLIIFFL